MAVRKIQTEISLTGEREFNDQMKAVNNNLKSLSAELNASSAAMASEGQSVETLTRRQQLLDQQVEQQKEKVRALAEMHQKAAAAAGEDSAAADRYRQQLANAEAALSKMEAQQTANNKALEAARPRWKQAADAVRDFAEKHEKGLKALGATAKATGLLTAAGGAAVGALSLLTVVGIKGLSDAAVDLAQNGDPAFAGLAANLEGLSEGAAAFKGAIASVLLPSLESLSGEGAQWLRDFSAAIVATNGDSQAMASVMADFIRSGVEILRNGLPQLLQGGKEILGAVVQGAVESLPVLAPEILALAEELISTLLEGLDENAELLAEGAVLLVTELATYLLTNAPQLLAIGVTLLTTLINGLADSMPELIPVALQTVMTLATALITSAPELLAAGLELILGIIQGLIEGAPQLAGQVPELIDTLKQAFSNMGSKLKEIGRDIMNNIFAGLKEVWGNISAWFDNVFGGLGSRAEASLPGAATGINYVPYDNFAVRLHEGEMVVPKRLATQLRAMGLRKDSDPSNAAGSPRVTNNFYPQTMTQAQMDYLAAMINRILGGEMP